MAKAGKKSGTKRPRQSRHIEEPSEQERAAEERAIKFISKKKLMLLVAAGRTAHQEGRAIAGEFGSSVKEAKENDSLHTKAFGHVRGLDRMEPERLADFFAHYDYYVECLGLRKRAGSVQRLPLDGEASEDETDPAARTGNVRPFPQPAGQAAE